MRLGVAGVGLKGRVFLERLVETARIAGVVSYRQDDDDAAAGDFARIRDLCAARGIPLAVEHRLGRDTMAAFDLLFLVGWQYLVDAPAPSVIVIHDALLPRYRGFAPTVTALIKGEPRIGVSALRPAAAVDAGPLLGQRGFEISYPITIAEALHRQAREAADLARELAAAWPDLTETPQDDAAATYAIWRDRDDGWIDWHAHAAAIARFVDAVGPPYHGALTRYRDQEIIVHAATPLPDLAFELRQPGKIWRLDHGAAVVVCGTGLLRIDRATTADGSPFHPTGLRGRLT